MSAILNASKTLTDLVVSAGVGVVLTNAIKATTPANLKLPMKALVFVGSFAVSSIVGTTASTYVKTQFGEITDSIKGASKTDPDKND